jgi:excisionase family DNA binding protein
MTSSRLLTLKEVSRILNINPEVLRRWLRSKKLPGIKVGSDWRVNEKDLEPFVTPVSEQTTNESNQPKMCFRFPKWLEFSGLPSLLNGKYGPESWPVFKKIIELDFEQGKPDDREISIELDEIAERVGYSAETVKKVLGDLANANLINFQLNRRKNATITVITPLKTPKMVFDISFEKGGIKGAPGKALENNCLRRFLEADKKDF